MSFGEPPQDRAAGKAQLTIVAVDDDSLVLMNTVDLLEDLGHIVLEATTPEEALAFIRQDPGIDLLVTDQAMPDMTGAELAEIVRVHRPDLPVILATGYGEFAVVNDATIYVLPKPFTGADLAKAVASVMRPDDRAGDR